MGNRSSPPRAPRDQPRTPGRLQKASKALRTSWEAHLRIPALHVSAWLQTFDMETCLKLDRARHREGRASRVLIYQGSSSPLLLQQTASPRSTVSVNRGATLLPFCPPRRNRGCGTYAPLSASRLSTRKAQGEDHSESLAKKFASQMARVFNVTCLCSKPLCQSQDEREDRPDREELS